MKYTAYMSITLFGYPRFTFVFARLIFDNIVTAITY